MKRIMNRDRDEHRGVSPIARILAPIALVAAAVIVIIVVAGSIGASDEAGGEEGAERQRGQVADCSPTEPQAVRDGYYVVQPGEPGLSAVSDKTCVPMRRLQRLNERLDPQLIPQGACVNLRRDGCKALAES